jgi:uncharacterized protein
LCAHRLERSSSEGQQKVNARSTPPYHEAAGIEGGQIVQLLIGGLIGLGSGVLSGIFGIGGGLVIVPSLILLMGMTVRQAVGTSLAALLLPVGILGVLEYFRAGQIDVRVAIVLALGLLVGVYFGARLALQLPPELVQRAFGVLMIVVGVRLALFVA